MLTSNIVMEESSSAQTAASKIEGSYRGNERNRESATNHAWLAGRDAVALIVTCLSFGVEISGVARPSLGRATPQGGTQRRARWATPPYYFLSRVERKSPVAPASVRCRRLPAFSGGGGGIGNG